MRNTRNADRGRGQTPGSEEAAVAPAQPNGRERGGGPARRRRREIGAAEAEEFRRGRRLGAAELQLLLVDLLAAGPGHGYELMQALGERSNGFYKPSPGVIYPALNALLSAGHADADVDGNRKRYRISEAGRQWRDRQREEITLLWKGLLHAGRKMEWVRRALAGQGASDEAGEAEHGWLPEFVQARLALKRAMLLRTDASVEEQRRIAAILQRAVAEIELVPHAPVSGTPFP